MDILSLGKASKVLRTIQNLNDQVVAPLAESRFPTVDARLDWLEGQASQLKAENSLQVDLSKGTFTNTELVNGKIQLKTIQTGQYQPSGTYESPILDLGEGWYETKAFDLTKVINVGSTNTTFEISTSIDGVTFSAYASLVMQQSRYVKIRASLSSTPLPAEVNTYQYNQPAENKVTLNEYVLADGDIKLKKDYTYTSEDVSVDVEGKIIQTYIPKTLFKSLNTLEVK
jgi:hypothetical protein